jgi:putative exosortase-associated protein (TIGR04073 family)
MKRILSSGLIVLMIMSLCSIAYGAEKSPVTKGERGFKNLVLGWTEIPKSVIDTSKDKNLLVGCTFGVLKGVVNAFARTVSGTADITTAPIGSYEKQPVKPSMVE